MDSKLRDSDLDFIKEVEGVRRFKYLDSAGKPTIGVGHLIKSWETFKEPLSDEAISALLRADLGWAEGQVASAIKVPLNANQYAAMVSFEFNTGALGQEHPIQLEMKLNAGQYDAVPTELRRWVWKHVNGKAVKDDGLVNRREKEVALWLKPV